MSLRLLTRYGLTRAPADGGEADVVIEPTGSGNVSQFSLRTYGQFTPAADTQLRGLRDAHQASGLTLSARVWRVSDQDLLSVVTDITQDGGVYEARFESEVTLLEGVAYRIGWTSVSGNVNAVGSSRAWEGFTTLNRTYYGSGTVYPNSFTRNWNVVFSLLVAP